MYRVKPILVPIAVCLFFVMGTIGSAEAGALVGKKLMVDTALEMADSPADAVNDSVNTLPPAAAGDTIKVQLFVEDAGGVVAVGFDAKFADSNMEAMFTDSWKIVGFDGIFNVPLAVGPDVLTLTYFAPGVVGAEVPANGYIGTVEVVAQTDIGEGAYFYVSKADIGTGAGLDSLDTSAARVSFYTPINVIGAGDALTEGNMLDVPPGDTVAVNVSLQNMMGEDPGVSWTISTEGDGTLLIVDMEGNMLDLDDQMMLSGPTSLSLKVTGGDLKVTVKANVDGRDAVPAVFTFTQLPLVVGSGDALMEGNMLDVPPGDTVAVNVSLQNMMGEDPGVSWTISTEGDGTLLIVDMEGNMLDLDDQMMLSGPTSLSLKVTGGDLKVTVKANVDGRDAVPAVFTFTQLPPIESPIVVGSGDALMEGNMLDIPPDSSVAVQLGLENVDAEDPNVRWTVTSAGAGTLVIEDMEGNMLEPDVHMMVSGPASLTLKVSGGDLEVTVKANVNGVESEPVTFTFTQIVLPAVVGSGDSLMEGNMVEIGPGDSVSVNIELQNLAEGDSVASWTISTEGDGTLVIMDADGNTLDLDEQMMLSEGPTSLTLLVTGGDLTVTIKASVGGLESKPAVFTFDQVLAIVVVGMGDALMEGNMLQIPASDAVELDVGLKNVEAEEPSIRWTITSVGTGTLVVLDMEGNVLEPDENMMVSGPASLKLKVSGGDLEVTVKANVNGEETEPVSFTFTQIVLPAVVGSGDALMEGNMVEMGRGDSVSVNIGLENVAEGDSVASWTISTEGDGTLVIMDADGNTLDLDEQMMLSEGPTSLTLMVTGGDLTVTVKASVGGLESKPAVFTFDEVSTIVVVGMGPDLLEGNMLQVPADGSGAGVAVTLQNVESEEPAVLWTVTYTGSKPLIFDQELNMLELDEHMMLSGPTVILLQVLTGASQVTVKANVDGVETDAVVFTFTQLNPAELASFDGALQEEKVVLNWSTVSQTNNAGWQITRSLDGENFEAIGDFVQGAGTSDALQNYSFEDKNLPGVEKVYYRLEQVDLDGSVSRSNVIEVILGARMPLPTEFAVNVYPNPFNPSTTISYELPEGAPVTVVIYDVVGQQVRHLISQFNSAGRYQVKWDARDNQGRGVASGVYIARIDAGTSTLSQKMLLLK